MATIVGRDEWNATKIALEYAALPVPTQYVVVAHTSGRLCTTLQECSFVLKYIQESHIKRGFGDIGYNFLIGGDGRVYVARGWDARGRHTKPFNDKSLGIAFIGTFMTELPPARSLRAAHFLLEQGVQLGKLSSNYTIYVHKQLIATESPGAMLIEEIKVWPHWHIYDPLQDDPQFTTDMSYTLI